jgi:hypothetical protein
MSKGGRKKPISKKVLFNLESLQRRRGIRDLEKRFLIVCEDGKSAPNYFEALKKHFNLSATSIRVVGSGGRTQPTQVVARAIEIKELAASPNSGTEPFDEVWCVIDGDYGNKINNARTSAKANGIELAISTMCFEYWILLHFEENNTSTHDCDEMVSRLKGSYLPDYEKGTCDFQDVVAQVEEACARAEKLRKPGITRGDLPEVQNPCSEVYRLIKALRASGA